VSLSESQRQRLYREAVKPERRRIAREDLEILLYDTIWNNRETMSPWQVLEYLSRRFEVNP